MPFINLEQKNGLPYAEFPATILQLWQKLALSTAQADPVCCGPDWNLAFHSVFFPADPVYYLKGFESLLLFRKTRAANGICLTPLEDSWCFGQPLLGFHAPELLSEALEIFWRVFDGSWPVLLLSGIRKNSPETLKIYTLHSRDFNFYRSQCSVQCCASLAGGLDGWLSRRSANHRAKLRKAARKARECGVIFDRCRPSSVPEALTVYERMLAIESQSWKGLGHCGMTEPMSCSFYGALMARYAKSSMASVIFAKREDRDIGFVFGGTTDLIYRGQQFSYIQEESHLSIGNLLQLEQIKWLCELGVQRYDMGPITGPRMGYKQHWTEEFHEVESWLMRKK